MKGYKVLCYLTDGYTVAKTRNMTKEELEIANKKAFKQTGGSWYWVVKCPRFDSRVYEGGGYCFNPTEVRGL